MKISPWLLFAALVTLAFTLATRLAASADGWSQRTKSTNVFGMLFGDSRKLLANQFFTMADVYFHSGYYPSIFDRNATEQKEIISASHGKKENEEDEKKEDFLGQPKDWIDAFGRNFRVVKHTHLEHGNEREILPWLQLAADLDPQKIETYTVGAFFLREHLNEPKQAEAFLRQGLRNNPDSCDILFELGRIYFESYHDLNRARNVWTLGVKKYHQESAPDQKDNEIIYEEIVVNLARLEEDAGNYDQAISWFEAGKKVSPAPDALQVQIDAVRKKMAETAPAAPPKNP